MSPTQILVPNRLDDFTHGETLVVVKKRRGAVWTDVYLRRKIGKADTRDNIEVCSLE